MHRNPELYPRTPEPSTARLDYYRALWGATLDRELIAAMADEQMSALSDVMADEYSVASAHALADEINRRGLRAAVSAEIERRRALPPVVVELAGSGVPF